MWVVQVFVVFSELLLVIQVYSDIFWNIVGGLGGSAIFLVRKNFDDGGNENVMSPGLWSLSYLLRIQFLRNFPMT